MVWAPPDLLHFVFSSKPPSWALDVSAACLLGFTRFSRTPVRRIRRGWRHPALLLTVCSRLKQHPTKDRPVGGAEDTPPIFC